MTPTYDETEPTYYAEIDTIEGCYSEIYRQSLSSLFQEIEKIFEEEGGGHADIYAVEKNEYRLLFDWEK